MDQSDIPSTSGTENVNLSNPFGYLESSVSSEQLHTWQQMNEKVKGLVQMSDEEDETDYLLDDALLITDAEIEIPSTSAQQGTSGNDDSATTSAMDVIFNKYTVDKTLTLQYLSGKISFLEFSEIMEKGDNSLEKTTDDGEGDGDTKVEGEEAEMEVELDTDKKAEPVKPKVKKKRRRPCQLPKLLEYDMGEVNLAFAKGDHEMAIKQCMEIIRQAPQANKPFQTLSMIYEDLGDMQKSLQYSLIAAYLDPRDEDEWARLADLTMEQNNVDQAIKCYTNAMKAASTPEKKLDYLWERSMLYEELKEYKKSLEGYQSILSLLPTAD